MSSFTGIWKQCQQCWLWRLMLWHLFEHSDMFTFNVKCSLDVLSEIFSFMNSSPTCELAYTKSQLTDKSTHQMVNSSTAKSTHQIVNYVFLMMTPWCVKCVLTIFLTKMVAKWSKAIAGCVHQVLWFQTYKPSWECQSPAQFSAGWMSYNSWPHGYSTVSRVQLAVDVLILTSSSLTAQLDFQQQLCLHLDKQPFIKKQLQKLVQGQIWQQMFDSLARWLYCQRDDHLVSWLVGSLTYQQIGMSLTWLLPFLTSELTHIGV